MMRLPKIEVYQSRKDWKWRFRLVGGNGEKQVPSQGYTTEYDAIRGARDARRNMLVARIVKLGPVDDSD